MKKTAVALLCVLAASPLVCAETVEADLVVVGSGHAGLAAALQATEWSAKGVLVEAGSVIQEGVQTASGALPFGTILLKGDRHESWQLLALPLCRHRAHLARNRSCLQ